MGYYDIYSLFENENWKNRCRCEGGELLADEGNLVCPHCLMPFVRAQMVSDTSVSCPCCGREIALPG
jgi:hypothetical protein